MSDQDQTADRRKFTRVPFRTRAILTAGSTRIEGEMENLSLQGMLFKAECPNLRSGDVVEIRISLTGDTSNLSFLVTGTIARQQKDGLAIQFDLDRIPFDSLTHLRYMVSYNVGDFDLVMNEYFNYLSSNRELS